MNRFAVAVAVGTYVVGTLWAAADAAPRTPQSVPPGCTIVGVLPGDDEKFPLAHCADGRWLYADMDGNGTREQPRNVGVWRDASGYGFVRQ
jgi:hypothetical protein